MKIVLALFLFSISALADCFDDECLSEKKVMFEGPFNSDGKIKISCAFSSHFRHVYVAMSYEYTTANNEALKGRTIDWINDVGCGGYKKVWTKAANLYFGYEYTGDGYNEDESPKPCVLRFEWDHKNKKFLEKDSKCGLSAGEIKDNKAIRILDAVETKILHGNFKALPKLSKKQTQFLKDRFSTTTYTSFRSSYEEAIRSSGLKYVNKKKSFQAHLDYLTMVAETKAWFDRQCPDVEVVACKADHDEEDNVEEKLIADFRKRMLKPKFALDWLNLIEKRKDKDAPILGIFSNELYEEVHDLLDGLSAEKQVSARLKLIDLVTNDEAYYNDKVKFYDKYYLAIGETRRCNEIPVRVREQLDASYTTEFNTEDYEYYESSLKNSLASKEKDQAAGNLVALIAMRIGQKKCELIPKDYFKKLRAL